MLQAYQFATPSGGQVTSSEWHESYIIWAYLIRRYRIWRGHLHINPISWCQIVKHASFTQPLDSHGPLMPWSLFSNTSIHLVSFSYFHVFPLISSVEVSKAIINVPFWSRIQPWMTNESELGRGILLWALMLPLTIRISLLIHRIKRVQQHLIVLSSQSFSVPNLLILSLWASHAVVIDTFTCYSGMEKSHVIRHSWFVYHVFQCSP